jgi:hypothetical protein
MIRLNKNKIRKAVDVETKNCFKCLGEFPKDELENVYDEIVDPALFCKFCAEDERENYYKTHQG